MHLVKTRVFRMNGRAFCIDMYVKEARAGGETEQRLYVLDARRRCYSVPLRAGHL